MLHFSNRLTKTIILIVILGVIFGIWFAVSKSKEAKQDQQVSINYIEAKEATWTKDQSLGAVMTNLDFGNDSFIIFHGYFGLFAYDLQDKKITKSLDLKAIGCDGIQGDNACIVEISKDGRKAYLHPVKNSNMYVFDIKADSTKSLYEVPYKEQVASNVFHTVAIETAVRDVDGSTYSDEAIKYKNGNNTFFGYLETSDFTVGTLNYVVDNKVYKLFD